MSNARNLASAGATAAGGMAPTGVVLPFAGAAAAHTHSGIVTGTGSVTNITNTAGGSATAGSVNTASSTAAGGAHSHVVTVNSTGSDGAHNNTQPTIVLSYIIKT